MQILPLIYSPCHYFVPLFWKNWIFASFESVEIFSISQP